VTTDEGPYSVSYWSDTEDPGEENDGKGENWMTASPGLGTPEGSDSEGDTESDTNPK
jgi:hypothetical protein